MRNLILIISVLWMSQALFAQSLGKKYTQVLIDSDFSEDEALVVTDGFYIFPGVETSRMDPTTHIYLCIYEESVQLNELVITTWFGNNGYTVKCYYTDDFGSKNFIDLKDTNCE